MDSFNYLHINIQKASQFILILIDDENYKVTWHAMNKTLTKYTRRRHNQTKNTQDLISS